jgi:hypothetical protein
MTFPMAAAFENEVLQGSVLPGFQEIGNGAFFVAALRDGEYCNHQGDSYLIVLA